MDIALVIIDQAAKKMEFSGAKNPLLYFQNGYANKIKGDKMPIGSNWKRNQYERNFANHVIDLEVPTTIYLYSDGYQDQFGGERNEKFMSKQLLALLTEIHEKPLTEQGHILDNRMAQWMVMGNEPQLDDILIIGAKIDL